MRSTNHEATDYVVAFLQSFDTSVISTEISSLAPHFLCTTRNFTDRVSHPYNTKGRITVYRIKTAQDVIYKLVLIAHVGVPIL